MLTTSPVFKFEPLRACAVLSPFSTVQNSSKLTKFPQWPCGPFPGCNPGHDSSQYRLNRLYSMILPVAGSRPDHVSTSEILTSSGAYRSGETICTFWSLGIVQKSGGFTNSALFYFESFWAFAILTTFSALAESFEDEIFCTMQFWLIPSMCEFLSYFDRCRIRQSWQNLRYPIFALLARMESQRRLTD